MAPAGYPVFPGTWLVFFSRSRDRYFFYRAPARYLELPGTWQVFFSKSRDRYFFYMAPAGYPVLPGTWQVFLSKSPARYILYMAPRKFMSGPYCTCPHIPMHSPLIHARALRADSSGVVLVRARAACATIIRDTLPLRWLAGSRAPFTSIFALAFYEGQPFRKRAKNLMFKYKKNSAIDPASYRWSSTLE